jgi:uncharacterized caspase-like protein
MNKAAVKNTFEAILVYLEWLAIMCLIFICIVMWPSKSYAAIACLLVAIFLLLPPLKQFTRKLPLMSDRPLKAILIGSLVLISFVVSNLVTESVSGDALANMNDHTSRGVVINAKADTGSFSIGKYYAIIIGMSDYTSKTIPKLERPVKDAREFYATLEENYRFDSMLLIADATKSDIMKTLMRFRKVLTTNDNLLIFYAGHGFEDKTNKQGYWLPTNAELDDPTNWISNSDIIDQINPIPAKHKLVISDACFSGGIFAARSVNLANANVSIRELYQSASCTAMTSGAHTEVPDESVFLRFLVGALQTDTSRYLSARNLFYSFCDKATSSSKIRNLIPQYGPILNSENNGGDFVFIRK